MQPHASQMRANHRRHSRAEKEAAEAAAAEAERERVEKEEAKRSILERKPSQQEIEAAEKMKKWWKQRFSMSVRLAILSEAGRRRKTQRHLRDICICTCCACFVCTNSSRLASAHVPLCQMEHLTDISPVLATQQT